MWPISNKKTVARTFLTPISSNRTLAHFVLRKVKLFNKIGQFQVTGQLRTAVLTSFIFITKTPSSSEALVGQSVYTQISSNTTVAQGALDKFQVFKKSHQFQAQRHLRRVF